MSDEKAVVLFSGGQDSTTCLYWAINRFGGRGNVTALTFDYGQRHRHEIDVASRIADLAGVVHRVLHLDTLSVLGGSSLTGAGDVEATTDRGLPTTFVPGRNLAFLTYAAAYAYVHKVSDLVTGVCQTDYSGYPDCRLNTMRALELSLSLGLDWRITIHTPLMDLNKREMLEMAEALGVVDVVLNMAHTCYRGVDGGCGSCPACVLREKARREYAQALTDRGLKVTPLGIRPD